MAALAAGDVFGHYRILGRLGRGGMASVYRAYEPALDREVALKVLPESMVDDAESARRFEREVVLIARLEHPSILPVYAGGITEGRPWMALRLVSGGNLLDWIHAHPREIGPGLQIFRDVAHALDYAHAQGILHRDLKPQNVLIGRQGEAYLADFGIARLLSESAPFTVAGAVLGTPQYMAPEQAQDQPLGPACDLYALAVMLYEWLCGRLPFHADTPLGVMYKHAQAPVPREPMARLPAPAQAVLLRGLHKDPRRRGSSAVALVDDLERALQSAPKRPHRRHGFVLALLLGLGLAVAAWWGSRTGMPPTRVPEYQPASASDASIRVPPANVAPASPVVSPGPAPTASPTAWEMDAMSREPTSHGQRATRPEPSWQALTEARLDYPQAVAGCAALGAGWRLPDRVEVESLHRASAGLSTPCGRYRCQLPASVQLRDAYVWLADEADGAQAEVADLSLQFLTYRAERAQQAATALCLHDPRSEQRSPDAAPP